MRGFGLTASTARFCDAFDEQRQYVRRTTMRQRPPAFVAQPQGLCARQKVLLSALMAA